MSLLQQDRKLSCFCFSTVQPPTLSSSKLSKVADWVINSPFQSPNPKETVIIPDSDDDSIIINVSEATSKGQEKAKKVHRLNVFGHRVSLSSSDNYTDHSDQRIRQSTTPENINNLWQISGN